MKSIINQASKWMKKIKIKPLFFSVFLILARTKIESNLRQNVMQLGKVYPLQCNATGMLFIKYKSHSYLICKCISNYSDKIQEFSLFLNKKMKELCALMM